MNKLRENITECEQCLKKKFVLKMARIKILNITKKDLKISTIWKKQQKMMKY